MSRRPEARLSLVVDCDSHVMEPVDLWLTHLEPRFRDRAIRIRTEFETKALKAPQRRQQHQPEPTVPIFPLSLQGCSPIALMTLKTYSGRPLGRRGHDAAGTRAASSGTRT